MAIAEPDDGAQRRRIRVLRIAAAAICGGGGVFALAAFLVRDSSLAVLVLAALGAIVLGSILAWASGLLALSERLFSLPPGSQRQGVEFIAAGVAVASAYLFLTWSFSGGGSVALAGPFAPAAVLLVAGRSAERRIGLAIGVVWLVCVGLLLLAGLR